MPPGSEPEFCSGWLVGCGVRALPGYLLGGRIGDDGQVEKGSLVAGCGGRAQFSGCRYGSVALARECASRSLLFGVDAWRGGGCGALLARGPTATSSPTTGRCLGLKRVGLALWYPTSREKRARCGAPGVRLESDKSIGGALPVVSVPRTLRRTWGTRPVSGRTAMSEIELQIPRMRSHGTPGRAG
jgi:hypothetical protein